MAWIGKARKDDIREAKCRAWNNVHEGDFIKYYTMMSMSSLYHGYVHSLQVSLPKSNAPDLIAGGKSYGSPLRMQSPPLSEKNPMVKLGGDRNSFNALISITGGDSNPPLPGTPTPRNAPRQ